MRFQMLKTSITASLFAIVASTSYALSVDPGSSGLDLAAGCSDPFCAAAAPTGVFSLDLTSPTPALGGDLDITGDITGSTLDFNITLDSATLDGSDGPITGVIFSDVTYSGSVTVTDQSPNGFSVDANQTATVAGTLTPIGGGSATPFDISDVRISGLCTGTPGEQLTCGLGLGLFDGFEIDVDGSPRYFAHQIDVAAVIPEPGTALLLGMGLSILGVQCNGRNGRNGRNKN